jgi:nitroreductase
VNQPRTVPLEFVELPPERMLERARELAVDLARRRSVRDFSDRPVSRDVIAACLAAAVTAPSGANQQPWHFVAVGDPAVKRAVREAAEQEERDFYGGRAPDVWLETLHPLGTDAHKPFLEKAPWLIAIFQQRHGTDASGRRVQHYYPMESVGLASGLLIGALHRAGLATLTHTPSPMKFLNEILGRPKAEKPFLLLVVGYPAEGCRVPDIVRKPLDETVSWFEDTAP